MEIWKPIKGFEGRYEVSNNGNVRSLVNARGTVRKEPVVITSAFHQHNRYISVTLWKDGKGFSKLVHRLVAEEFLPNPNNYPVVNHIDEDKQNNCVNNLEWCTQKDNCNWGSRNSRIIETRNARQTSNCCKPIVGTDKQGNKVTFASISEAGRALAGTRSSKITADMIFRVLNGARKSTLGFTWQYN